MERSTREVAKMKRIMDRLKCLAIKERFKRFKLEKKIAVIEDRIRRLKWLESRRDELVKISRTRPEDYDEFTDAEIWAMAFEDEIANEPGDNSSDSDEEEQCPAPSPTRSMDKHFKMCDCNIPWFNCCGDCWVG